MKKLRFIVVVLLLVVAWPTDAKMSRMSDDAAKSKAISMWGPQGAVSKFWVAGAANSWAYQVGCYDPVLGFHVTGEGLTSWESAYANVKSDRNGTFSIFATSRQANGGTTVTPKIHFYACDAIFDKNMARFAVAN